MTQPHFDPRGAVDLSMLQKPTAAQEAAAKAHAEAAAKAPGVILDLTAENFQEVIEGSAKVPLVVAVGASRSATGEKLTPTLERAALAFRGRFVLARLDADAQPQLAQVFGVQGVPCAIAVIQGQPLPLFQGAPAPEQVAQVLEQVLEAAAKAGVDGTVPVDDTAAEEAAAPVEPELPPLHAAAYDAIEAGDYDGAAAAYRQALNENPADAEAKLGLGQVALMARLADVNDPVAVIQAADAAAADDVAAHLAAADVELAAGRAGAAFERLVALVRATRGDEREQARKRLVELFELVDPASPELAVARKSLALALF